MAILRSENAPSFHLPGLDVIGLAAPSRGARETSLLRIRLPAGTTGTPHAMDREEIFLAIGGSAVATLGEEQFELRAGDTMIVPAGQVFSLANPGSMDFEAIAAAPAGVRACMPGGAPFPPPWTE